MNYYVKHPSMCIPHGAGMGAIVALIALLIQNDWWIPEVWIGLTIGTLGGAMLQFVYLPIIAKRK